MHIKLKNKKLLFDNYKIKCIIGKRGISSQKEEGDGKTPRGTFKILSIFYRKDRIQPFKTKLKKIIIKGNMGWCDDVKSPKYNKLIKFPFKFSAEKFFLKKSIYNIIVVLNYNVHPVIKKKGSAIFLHLTSRKCKFTEGCLAINKRDMILLLGKINKKSKITIF